MSAAVVPTWPITRSRPVHALLGMGQLALTNDGTPTSIVFPTCDTKDSQLPESNDAVNPMTRPVKGKSNDSLSSVATVAAATEASTPQMTSSRSILAALLDRHHQAAGDDGDDGDDGDNGEDGALGDPPMDCNVLSAMQSRAAQKLPMKKPAKFVVLKKPSASTKPTSSKSTTLMLAKEATRNTWRARIGSESKGFRYGKGYGSEQAAKALALKYLDDICKRSGQRFPRNRMSFRI